MDMAGYHRKSTLIDTKFTEYLWSIIFAAMAMSANVIVDGIIVGNLLGADALAAVNIAGPVPMLVSVFSIVIGLGGATSIAIQKGRREPALANRIYTVCLTVAAFLMVSFFLAGQLFFTDIMGLFSLQNGELYAAVASFLQPILLGLPLMVITAVMQFLISADGFPRLVMRGAILNSATNLCMDVIYIKVFGMGIEGAAWATVTGFVVGLVFLAWFYWRRNPKYNRTLEVCRISLPDFSCLGMVFRLGVITALMQFFLFLQQFCMNNLVLQQFGAMGMVALAVCLNCRMLIFIVINGASNSMGPILGMLLGERDRQGVRFLLRRTFRFILAAGTGIFLLLECAPEIILTLYGITDVQAAALGVRALRIFVLAIPLMGITTVMTQYYQIIRELPLAVVLGCTEGFLGVVPVAYLLTSSFGRDTLWLSFLVAEILALLVLFLGSKYIAHRAQGRKKGIFLLQETEADRTVYEATARNVVLDAVQVSQAIIESMRQSGIEEKQCGMIGVAVEEMLMEMKLQNARNCDVDLIVRQSGEHIVLAFRDNGAACNYLEAGQAEDKMAVSGIALLKRIATEVRYDYVMGFNCMRVVI